MNKVVLGQYALGVYYLGMGDNLKAVEAFKNSTDHPDAWRLMGLAYADLEDLENSISAFSSAIKAGDTKSIPWLVDLLESSAVSAITNVCGYSARAGKLENIFKINAITKIFTPMYFLILVPPLTDCMLFDTYLLFFAIERILDLTTDITFLI